MRSLLFISIYFNADPDPESSIVSLHFFMYEKEKNEFSTLGTWREGEKQYPDPVLF